MDKDKQKPENINDVVLTPLPTDETAQKLNSAPVQVPPRTATREYDQYNDPEAKACQYIGGAKVRQEGIDFCSKPYCKCACQQNYEPGSIRKKCSCKPK